MQQQEMKQRVEREDETSHTRCIHNGRLEDYAGAMSGFQLERMGYV